MTVLRKHLQHFLSTKGRLTKAACNSVHFNLLKPSGFFTYHQI